MGWLQEFGEVDLGAIESPGIEANWTHTKGYSRAEVEGWVKELQTVQNLSRTQGLRHEDFQRMRESANQQEHGLGETHHRFYDSARLGRQGTGDPIKLTWNKGRFEIENGRHRVDRAQALGLRNMPARYSVREEERAGAAAHVQRNGPLWPADRDEAARGQQTGHEVARQPSDSRRNATPAWERGSGPAPVRGERTRG